MANAIIGALRVVLGADTAQLDKGLKDAQGSLYTSCRSAYFPRLWMLAAPISLRAERAGKTAVACQLLDRIAHLTGGDEPEKSKPLKLTVIEGGKTSPTDL